MKFGKVFTYKDVEEAKAYIGKEGNIWGLAQRDIQEKPEHYGITRLEIIKENDEFPFAGKTTILNSQFFRPIIEENK